MLLEIHVTKTKTNYLLPTMQLTLFINRPLSINKYKLSGYIIWLEGPREAKFQLFGMLKLKV